MSFWPSRTKMEHAKTRTIHVDKHKSNGETKKEEYYDEYEEIEKLEKEIDIYKQTTERLNSEIKDILARLSESNDEIKRLRELNDKNTIFMQNVIMELIHKPAAPAPVTSAATLLAARKEISQAATKPDTSSPTAGPKEGAKLP